MGRSPLPTRTTSESTNVCHFLAGKLGFELSHNQFSWLLSRGECSWSHLVRPVVHVRPHATAIQYSVSLFGCRSAVSLENVPSRAVIEPSSSDACSSLARIFV